MRQNLKRFYPLLPKLTLAQVRKFASVLFQHRQVTRKLFIALPLVYHPLSRQCNIQVLREYQAFQRWFPNIMKGPGPLFKI